MENCKHEAELKRICRVLDGNGQPGLIRDVSELKVKITDMDESLDKLATAYSALARNDSNREAIRKAMSKGLVNMSLILGIFGTIITLIITLT